MSGDKLPLYIRGRIILGSTVALWSVICLVAYFVWR